MEGRDIIEGQPTPPRREEQQRPVAGGGYSEPPGENITQQFAFIVGAVYLAVGVIGFAVTGFTGITSDGGDSLVGFDLNVFHNVVHLAIGLGFLVVSRLRDTGIAQGVVIGGGLVYVLAGLLGFLNELQILSIDDELAADNFLHLFSGVAAVVFGLLGARQSDSYRARVARA